MYTPEGRIKAKVKKILEKHGCYYFMPVQMGYGARTVDILACYKAIFIAIETKAPGKELTKAQEILLAKIKKAGGVTEVIETLEDLERLESCLEKLSSVLS